MGLIINIADKTPQFVSYRHRVFAAFIVKKIWHGFTNSNSIINLKNIYYETMFYNKCFY